MFVFREILRTYKMNFTLEAFVKLHEEKLT